LCLAAALSNPEGKVSGPILSAVEGEVKRDQLCLLACGDLSTEELAQARPIRCIRVGSFWVHRKPLESGLWSHHCICGRRVPDVHGGDKPLDRGPHLVRAAQRRSGSTTGCGGGRIRQPTVDSPLSLQPTAVNNANVITVIALSGQRLRLLLPIAPQIDLIEGEMQASPVRILSAAELLHTAGHGSHAREPLTAYGQKLLAIDNRLTLNRPGYRLRYSRSLEGSRDASKEGFHS